jgi:hypothetical protein
VVFAADDDTAHRTLGGVVVEGEPRVVEEAKQPRPEVAHVRDGLAERASRQGFLSQCPLLDAANNVAGVLLADSAPVIF